jgi:outer membrane protein
MKHRRILMSAGWCLLFSLLMSCVFAQEQKPLGLQEAIDLSLKNSKQLRSSQAKIQEATAALKEAVERRLPDASVSGSYLRLNSPNVDLKTKKDNTGGGTTTTESPKPSQAMYGIANVSLPIFSGFRIKYGIESARYLEQASKLDAENDQEEIILNTIDAYNNLFKAHAAVELVDSSLQSARERAAQFRNLEKNGLLPRNELQNCRFPIQNFLYWMLKITGNWPILIWT